MRNGADAKEVAIWCGQGKVIEAPESFIVSGASFDRSGVSELTERQVKVAWMERPWRVMREAAHSESARER
jgi:hypothetical protein